MIGALFVVQILLVVSIFSSSMRDLLLPDGTTLPETVILILLVFIWEDILRIKRRLGS